MNDKQTKMNDKTNMKNEKHTNIDPHLLVGHLKINTILDSLQVVVVVVIPNLLQETFKDKVDTTLLKMIFSEKTISIRGKKDIMIMNNDETQTNELKD